MVWLIRKWLESSGDYESHEELAVVTKAVEQAKAEYRQSASPVSVQAREIVYGIVPRHLLSNRTTRTGLDQQVQQMLDDGCDQRGIALALEEWTNRPDAYPGHLPHIYSELLRQRTAKPKQSPANAKMQGWLEAGARTQAALERQQ